MSEQKENAPAAQPQERHLRPPPAAHYAAHVNRWAIVVGISHYQHESLNLKYAHRDAQELYKLLQTPSGGGFEAERICLLVDDQATTAAVTRALRSFLKKPARDDVVLLYLACHGAPDPDRPDTIYLLTHDADPDDIAGTAVPMREIDLSLRENLLAERVVIIADTCHSAAIGGKIGRRSAGNEAQAVNAYLQAVSEARGGVALLTSAEAGETAREDKKWGGGHGVFTHYLLKGMGGEADGYGGKPDGKVAVGELFDYVRDNVKKATDNLQHPVIGTNPFDRSLPMAITGGVNAQEHYDLGRHLLELGWQLDDVERFRAAAKQFSEAVELSRMAQMPLLEAEAGLGQALLAAGEGAEAIQVLAGLLDRAPDRAPAAAWFHLALARGQAGEYSSAAAALEKYLALRPDDEYTPWLRDCLARSKDVLSGQRYALLIAIDRYFDPSAPRLRFCKSDAQKLQSVLIRRYGVQETNVFTLVDEAATRAGILAAFASLRQRATGADAVLVYYSGLGGKLRRADVSQESSGEVGYLAGYDFGFKSSTNAISAAELHQLMMDIPTAHKTLLLDTDANASFNDLAQRAGDYVVLVATDVGHAQEIPRVGGVFTYGLVQTLDQAGPGTLTYGRLLDATIAEIESIPELAPPPPGSRDILQASSQPPERSQTPRLIGDREAPFLLPANPYAGFLAFAWRRNYQALSQEALQDRYDRFCRQVPFPAPGVHCHFGRAFLEKGDNDAAAAALQAALAQRPGFAAALLALGQFQVEAGRYAEALDAFRQYASVEPEGQAIVELAEKLARNRKHALLVGIGNYMDPAIPPVRGAVNDVLALKKVLVDRYGFAEGDVCILRDGEATCAAIEEHFRRLVDAAREEPALFYFAGHGSGQAGQPTIVSADGRQGEVYDISLAKLAGWAQGATNLTTILDAGFFGHGPESRVVGCDERQPPGARSVWLSYTPIDREKFKIGDLVICPFPRWNRPEMPSSPARREAELSPPDPEDGDIRYYGVLTHTLVRLLIEAAPRRLTYRQWLEGASEVGPNVVGELSDIPVFSNRPLLDKLQNLLGRIEQSPAWETIELLRRLVEQREQRGDPYPEGWLNLGVAYAAVGEYDKGVSALERALDDYNDPAAFAHEVEKDPRAPAQRHEAHYQLGRILLEWGRDFARAVSELTQATGLDPDHARGYYYLGQAIRAMVERETLEKARQAFQTYLEMGAPCGHEEEVREFLEPRTTR